MSVVYIYSMSDPISGAIRYVGKTKNMQRRLRQHCRENRKFPSSCWAKSVLKKFGMRPIIEEIERVECVSGNEWEETERFWVNYLRFLGCDLLNLDNGGELNKKRHKSTAEKISKSNKGMIGPNLGRKFDAEWCKNMSISRIGGIPWNKGIPMSNEAKKHLSVTNRGKNQYTAGCVMSEYTKRKIGASVRATALKRKLKEIR